MKKTLLPLTIALLAASTQAGTVITDGADIKFSTQGGLSAATTDGMASISLGGQIQWDYDATDSDRGEDTKDMDLRRARLTVSGHYGDWAYRAQFNVSESSGGNGGRAEDLYIRYTGFGELANVTVGKQKEPFGLEALLSSNDMAVLERSALSGYFAPFRSAGIQLHGKGSNWTYGVGVFEGDGDGPNDFDNRALTGRVTFAPVTTDDMVVHLGAGYSMRDIGDGGIDDIDAYNLEFGFVSGPFHVQAEYFDAERKGILPILDLDADGYYLQLGWVITGETRPYRDGLFRRVRPAAASGAWEVLARYEDGYGNYSDTGLSTVEGKQMTVGVNYYVTNNVRFGLSYMSAEEDGSRFEGDELRARIQLTF